jgi:predicted DNA binding CopG/RHH family protein
VAARIAQLISIHEAFHEQQNPESTNYFGIGRPGLRWRRSTTPPTCSELPQLRRRRRPMKKEYDLRKLKRRSGAAKSDREAAKVPVSIRLDGSVLAALRTEAERLGIPYQTLVGSILHRYVIMS